MKLDMGQAWNTATAMLGANRDVVLIVAGVFFFLPYFALALFLPELVAGPANTADPDAAMAAVTAMYADNWWAFLIMGIAQGVGMLALLALLTDTDRPTVGEAIATGGRGFVVYFLTQLLLVIGMAIVLGVPLGLATASGLGALVGIIAVLAIVVGVYVFIKFSLISPVIAIDKISNPVAVLKRSWQLTKGNSFRLLAFFFLLLLAIGIVMMLATLVLGLLFAAIGGQVELIGNGFVSALANAVSVVIFLAVLAAVHRQLAGPSAQKVSETFE